MDVQKLIEKRANLWDSAKQFLDEHTDADGKISAEDAASYDKMEADIVALGKQIDRFEKQAARDAELSKPTTAPIRDAIGGNFDKELRGEMKSGRATDEYKAAMIKAVRTNFRQISNLLEEGTLTQGGYLVPDEWDSRLIDVLDEENVMRRLGTRITTSGEHKINIVASKPAAAWLSEGQAITFSNATFGQISLEAYKLGVGVQVTNELLYDNAFNLENYIIEQFGKALANAEEDAFINGDGNGKPTGFLTTIVADATAFSVTAGADIAADDVINLEYSLKRPYRRNAAFVTNDATLAKLRKFKDSTQNYLWQPSYIMGEPDRLLGYPIYTTPYMPKATSGNLALAFGDFSYYNIADRGSRTVRTLSERYAEQDISAFMILERVDAVLTLNEAVRALQIK
ncbi:MAG: phage major capsid protein [Selenomonadaceae bacterium]|nr:phage major capsid protein [Selenomonadaceae bacterium]